MIKELYRGKWLSLRKIVNKSKNIHGYEYLHENRPGAIAILPFRNVNGVRKFLIRFEVTPPWDEDEAVGSSFTGGVDEGESHEVAATRELKEESGFNVKVSDLIDLGTCYSSKMSDAQHSLYAVNITGTKRGKSAPENDLGEKTAYSKWSTKPWKFEDPLLSVMWSRLRAKGVLLSKHY